MGFPERYLSRYLLRARHYSRRAESESDDGEDGPSPVPPSGAEAAHQECRAKSCGPHSVGRQSSVKPDDWGHEDGRGTEPHEARDMPCEPYSPPGQIGRDRFGRPIHRFDDWFHKQSFAEDAVNDRQHQAAHTGKGQEPVNQSVSHRIHFHTVTYGAFIVKVLALVNTLAYGSPHEKR